MPGVVTVVRNDRKHQYEAHVDGAVVGVSKFRIRPGQVVFTHTEVDGRYEGRGYGTQLAKGVLDDVHARGERVVPLCPFIKAYIERHPEYADLVASDA